MIVELCGQKCDIPEGLTKEEQDKLINEFVDKVAASIPQETLDEIRDKAWLQLYGELPEARQKELAAKARESRMTSGSVTVLSEGDIKTMQEVMKADEEYEKEKAARKK